MTAHQKSDNLNFEKSLEKLDKIVKKMEQGQLSLEDSLKQFEEGVHLISQCQSALTTASQKIQILTQDAEKSTLEPFDYDDR